MAVAPKNLNRIAPNVLDLGRISEDRQQRVLDDALAGHFVFALGAGAVQTQEARRIGDGFAVVPFDGDVVRAMTIDTDRLGHPVQKLISTGLPALAFFMATSAASFAAASTKALAAGAPGSARTIGVPPSEVSRTVVASGI